MRHTAEKNVLMKVLNIFSYALFVLVISVTLVISFIAIKSRVNGTVPSIGGYQILKVVSGSMEPTIHTGSVVFIKEIDPSLLKVGDIITFISTDYDSELVTHRIVKIEETVSGSIFTTRGDANDADDITPLPASLIKGIEKFSIPLLGYVMNFLQSRRGVLLLIIIPCVILAVYEIKQIWISIRSLNRIKTEPQSDLTEK